MPRFNKLYGKNERFNFFQCSKINNLFLKINKSALLPENIG